MAQDGGLSVDALLVLSFGGPEGPEEVRPFLANVTRGRGVPPERLDAVARHYLHFGGRSPINDCNRDLIGRIRAELERRGAPLPVWFGNRNWHPLAEDTLAEMAAAGVRSALVLATSAYGGYSACRQYDEDIARARQAVTDRTGAVAPRLTKLRQFFDHPAFVQANVDAVRAALGRLPAELRAEARVVFTAHSVPTVADAAAGPPEEGGHRYSRQLAEAARLIADRVGVSGHDLAWQSRSGPPTVPWLEPDICDHLELLHDEGVRAVVVSPIGFVSDHLEVVWDLDNEAAQRAAELGLAFQRAATAGTDRRFAPMVADLIEEHTAGRAPEKLSALPAAGCTVDGRPCAAGCCEQPARRARPALSGQA
jgi:ferrochelatase